MRLEMDRLNLRDLGGLRTPDGCAVRPGRLLRSGALWSMTTAEQASLGPLLAVYDLRSARERAYHPDPALTEVHQHISVTSTCRRELVQSKHTLEDKVLDILQGYAHGEPSADARMRDIYVRLVFSPEMTHCAAQIIRRLSACPEGAVLWHCAAGKDRTGVLGAILLRVLGVSDADIRRDYLYTNVALADEIARAEALACAHGADAAAAQYVRAFFAASGEWLDAALRAMDSCGTAEEYLLRRTALSKQEVSGFRRSCLCGAAAHAVGF